MSVGMILFLLFIALMIYLYFYLKKKYGDISSAFKNIGNSLNPVNLIGDKVTSGVTDVTDKVGDGVKNIF
jgi:hypothetical protein